MLSMPSSQNRADKVNDFFEKLVPEIQSQQEWKEWFGKILLSVCSAGIVEWKPIICLIWDSN